MQIMILGIYRIMSTLLPVKHYGIYFHQLLHIYTGP